MPPKPYPLAAAALRLQKPPGRPRVGAGRDNGVQAAAHLAPLVPPRLLGRQASASYIGVSLSTFAALVARGAVRPVDLGLRRSLFDVRDLDDLIEKRKEGT